jgi:hypothetical protein
LQSLLHGGKVALGLAYAYPSNQIPGFEDAERIGWRQTFDEKNLWPVLTWLFQSARVAAHGGDLKAALASAQVMAEQYIACLVAENALNGENETARDACLLQVDPGHPAVVPESWISLAAKRKPPQGYAWGGLYVLASMENVSSGFRQSLKRQHQLPAPSLGVPADQCNAVHQVLHRRRQALGQHLVQGVKSPSTFNQSMVFVPVMIDHSASDKAHGGCVYLICHDSLHR